MHLMSEQAEQSPTRKIRSFIRRQGRITQGQEFALENYWGEYCLTPDKVLDAHQVFGRHAVLIDPRTGTAEPMSVKLDAARLNHLSTLLPQHDVLIWGGVGKDGLPLKQAELYQPGEPYFHAYGVAASAKLLAEINNPNPPVLVDSEPEDGAAEVAVGQMLSVRFSKPLKVTSVNAQTVVLIGPSTLTALH